MPWYEIRPWACSIPDEGDLDQTQYQRLEENISEAKAKNEEETLKQYADRNVSV